MNICFLKNGQEKRGYYNLKAAAGLFTENSLGMWALLQTSDDPNMKSATVSL